MRQVARIHEGKLAIVTGSARGIGSYIARKLASQGANVLVNYATDSSNCAAATLCKELHNEHRVTAIPCKADISTLSGCESIISVCKDNFSSDHLVISIIVHNAAVLYLGPVESVKPDEFDHIYRVNVLGPALLTGACKPYLPTDRSGRIVMVSSINSKVGLPNTTLYAGTKGALETMARVWCRELSENCTVNTINPGPVMTDMYMSAPDEVKEQLGLWNSLTPLVAVRDSDGPEVQELGKKFGGRAAYPEEIAGLVSMICSPESGWMTGSLVSANGGLTFSY
ncbi:3-oxoacyl-[acyl-carrier protein] reductase [Geosmithia morbida]|uniref:3-oxoacyl-[acyl-carrier protein] reductase n=1 Tax=Geosmithia morbida TaxID=1094350 RepID=A0A9P5D235_9HYPO|nr:3-oxoacyl-[acyl-carrier protein] reductase [Geosmithia morbida]KAF4120425.1 3-oxoacyl-[acyl-carrier protein] reductase [Geosmithia morbida]